MLAAAIVWQWLDNGRMFMNSIVRVPDEVELILDPEKAESGPDLGAGDHVRQPEHVDHRFPVVLELNGVGECDPVDLDLGGIWQCQIRRDLRKVGG